MNCVTAETWMLTARDGSELPEAVRAHLVECAGCARRLVSLVQTDKAVRNLAPGANSEARQRLADAVRRTPQAAAQTPARPRVEKGERPPRRIPGWAIAVAASLLLTLGWAVGRVTSPRPSARAPAPTPGQPLPPAPAPQDPHKPPSPAPGPEPAGLPVAPHPSLPAGLNARAARHAAAVAADPAPLAAAGAFERFAADVRAESIRRASSGDVESLPRLAGLHERLLKLGVARQFARVPEDQRTANAERVSDALDRAADEATAAAAQLPPAVSALLRPLPVACRETSESVRGGKPPPAIDWPAPPTPLETVAAQTLRVANAPAALARADESVRLATALAQAAAVLSEAGWSDDAARVGEAIATVLESGVAANLEQVEASDTTGTLRSEVKQMRERAGRATDSLERDLMNANPVAKSGLERALNASAPGRDKAAGRPGKGPPWKGDDHPGKGKGQSGWPKKP